MQPLQGLVFRLLLRPISWRGFSAVRVIEGTMNLRDKLALYAGQC